jgi:hypothetical protein
VATVAGSETTVTTDPSVAFASAVMVVVFPPPLLIISGAIWAGPEAL